jgi:hypothetical protein
MTSESKTPRSILSVLNCPEEDSNLHPVKDMALNHARLPVPPSGLLVEVDKIIASRALLVKPET